MITQLELFTGVEPQDTFTQKQYEEFCEVWQTDVVPILNEQDRRRALSEQYARNHLVN